MNENLSETILKKKSIVDVVAKLMDEEGLKNVKIKDICDGANVSVGAFYHYFSSKESIAYEMYELMDEYLISNYEELLNHSSSCEDIIDFVSKFGLYVEQWGYYANLLIMRTSIENANRYYNKPTNRKIYDILYKIIQTGITNKSFSIIIDAEELTNTILIAIRGYLLEWVKIGQDYPVRDKMLRHIKLLLSSIQQ